MESVRTKAAAGIEVGDSFTVRRVFTEADTAAFGDLTRDYNPVHYDCGFAELKGFPRLICHGLLVGSLITELGGQIGWLATDMSFRFKAPVFAGDTVTCRLTVTDIGARGRASARAVLTNQHGVTVVEAAVGGYLPGPAERELLARMADRRS